MEPTYTGHDTLDLKDEHVDEHIKSAVKARADEAFRQKTDVYRRLNPDGTRSPFLQLQKKGSKAAGHKRDPAQGHQLIKV